MNQIKFLRPGNPARYLPIVCIPSRRISMRISWFISMVLWIGRVIEGMLRLLSAAVSSACGSEENPWIRCISVSS